jgi:hypothetical protein
VRRDSFERFYYEKIALAEGCGCAEHVTRMRDIDDLVKARAGGMATEPRGIAMGWPTTAVMRVVRRLCGAGAASVGCPTPGP